MANFYEIALYMISIPAPARGRTPLESFRSKFTLQFQFPPPRGGEPRTRSPATPTHSYFNSRPREGANAPGGHVPHIARYFNSRPREGANIFGPLAPRRARISIPAPARGRTIQKANEADYDVFQFPPPRGGELTVRNLYGVLIVISIPAPARGRTPSW